MTGDCGYDYYEQRYSAHKWWNKIKNRTKNKTQKQKELDRRLVEAVGNPDDQPVIDFEKIKELVKEGAQVDHWVEYDDDERYNTIQLAMKNESEEMDKVIYFLISTFA